MITALILAASAPATLPDLYLQAAYLSGRCHVYMTPSDVASVEETVDAAPALRSMYDDGVRDSERQPMRGDVCSRAMAKITTDIRLASRYPQANRSLTARDSGTR